MPLLTHIFLARLERPRRGRRQQRAGVEILRDVVGDHVADELAERDDRIASLEERVAELEHKADETGGQT